MDGKKLWNAKYQNDKNILSQICKEPFPMRIFINKDENPLNLVLVIRPEMPYMILE